MMSIIGPVLTSILICATLVLGKDDGDIQGSSEIIYPSQFRGQKFHAILFQSGKQLYEPLLNVSIIFFPEGRSLHDACDKSTFPALDVSNIGMKMLIVPGVDLCYPENVAEAAKIHGFDAIGVLREGNLLGIRTSYLWRHNYREIPIFEMSPIPNPVNDSLVVSLYPEENPFSFKKYTYFIRILATLTTSVALLKLVIAISRFRGHYSKNWRRKNCCTAAMIISCLEITSSLCSMIHMVLDPWGFEHVLPYPWMRTFTFGAVNLSIVTIFVLAIAFHKALFNIKDTTLKTWIPIGLFFIFICWDITQFLVDITRAENFLAKSGISVSFDMVFVALFGLYFFFVKLRIISVLRTSVRSDFSARASELNGMSTKLVLAAIFMFGYTMSMGVYVTMRYQQRFAFPALTFALFNSNCAGVFHVLSLRGFSKENEDQQNEEVYQRLLYDSKGRRLGNFQQYP